MATIQLTKHKLKDGTEIILRHGVEDDAKTLVETVRTYVEQNEGQVWEPGEFDKTEAEDRKWIRGMLDNPRELLILAVAGEQIVGNIDFHAGTRRRTAHTGHFGMGILPEWRSRGLGTLLLGTLIEWARQVPDLEKLSLRVIASNERAIGLYRKHGFQQEGRGIREFRYSDGSYADDISMGLLIK